MNIDFIIGQLGGGGAERVLVLLASEMSHSKKVKIITFEDSEDYNYNKEVFRVKLHENYANNHTIRRFISLFKHYRKKENRPDVLISFLPTISFVTIPICKLFGIKIICSEHINHLQVENRIVSVTRKYLYKHANTLTVLTNFDKSYFSKKGIKTVVMPNPSTFKTFKGKIKNRKKEIIAVGSLNRYHHKGFDNLLEIIKPVLQKFPDWKLRIVGGGDTGMTYLKKKSEELHILDKVEFDGFKTNIVEIMQSSSIFVLSSRFEGLPMVLLEALSQGMACISYNCKTGPSEMIMDGINGLLIDDQYYQKMGNNFSRALNSNCEEINYYFIFNSFYI